MRSSRLGVLAAALLMVFAACSNDAGDLPDVPEFKPAATTTTGVDFSALPLKGVTGKATTTTVAFGPGKATLSGVVMSDDGLVSGASVLIDRIVGGSVASTLLYSLEDGTWSLPAVFGGRYRVRAFRQPDLAQTSASAVFLGSTETKTMELKLKEVGGINAVASIAPNPPLIDTDVNLVVLVTQKTVDERGIVRATPSSGSRVDLVGSGAWRVVSSNPSFTDDNGKAYWTVRCRASGRQPLAVNVGSQSFPLNIANCVDPAEETTTTVESGVVEDPNDGN